jgi:hypothetical protein
MSKSAGDARVFVRGAPRPGNSSLSATHSVTHAPSALTHTHTHPPHTHTQEKWLKTPHATGSGGEPGEPANPSGACEREG